MISNACATMRRVKSFLPLLRPFIIRLSISVSRMLYRHNVHYAPVHQSLDDGHLCLLKLLLGITACRVRQVDSMTNLNVICQGNILDFDTTYAYSSHKYFALKVHRRAHSWVSHLPKSLTSWPSLDISLGRAAIFVYFLRS